jgi:protoporphyrinogen oxidase
MAIFAKPMAETPKPKIVIAGAGPAGLTAAKELQKRGSYDIVILEAESQVGGIAKTVNYKGNRMDLGGHRFFSKSDAVMDWWLGYMAPERSEGGEEIAYQGQRRSMPESPKSAAGPKMLIRNRLSRIYYLRQFFAYPLALNAKTIGQLGIFRVIGIGISYTWAQLFPRKPERSLEDFFINRFGKRLYRTFFKDYTEKVWGVPCEQISAEWGAQRIKGLSVRKAIAHALKPKSQDLAQKQTETSLIERFLYPELGPGQLWELVLADVQSSGAQLRTQCRVTGLNLAEGRVQSVEFCNPNGEPETLTCDYFLSGMPLKDLVAGIQPPVEDRVAAVAEGLQYRDFMTCGVLLKNALKPLPDNWIYVQEPDVKLGRIQVFNNWSPQLVAQADSVWLGLEYFCQEGDELWSMEDSQFLQFAAGELETLGLIAKENVLDGTVIRVPKTYPAYFGSYEQFGLLQEWINGIGNLIPIGRNGMHRYNNQDHSMLTAMEASRMIAEGDLDKTALWAINTEMEYHEEK